MKKYRVSPYYILILTAAIVLILVPTCLICVIAWRTAPDSHGTLIAVFVLSFSAIILALYLMFFDFPCGTFSFDNDGFRMRIGMKRYYHKWSDIQDVGIIKTKIGNSSYFYICYFSGRTLTIEDKRRFFTKTRKNRKDIGFFQYNHERVIEIANYLPEHLKMELVFDERVLGLV
ncbi:MAG: hypothetical protein IKH56_03740 [Oscillospiraceae bacterium]|nr:hypothetical protein [Oscillospiraceae bacterium]